uniref:Uncharacterized protein n=1 Tax=Bionectria ochroleuca TaxID=29856 RepID=A0A0B7KK50_BIOOC
MSTPLASRLSTVRTSPTRDCDTTMELEYDWMAQRCYEAGRFPTGAVATRASDKAECGQSILEIVLAAGGKGVLISPWH